MERNIGITISGDYVCSVVEEKLRELVLATEALVLAEWVKPQTVEQVMGSWDWIMMVFRPEGIVRAGRPSYRVPEEGAAEGESVR